MFRPREIVVYGCSQRFMVIDFINNVVIDVNGGKLWSEILSFLSGCCGREFCVLGDGLPYGFVLSTYLVCMHFPAEMV
jgi:hypothetical protein